MKKLLFVFAIAAVGSLASCKKDYTCDCTVAGIEQSAEIKDSKKGDAEDSCDTIEANYKSVDSDATCELN